MRRYHENGAVLPAELQQEVALEGLFRIIDFPVPEDSGADYESALLLLRPQIQNALELLRGLGVKYYLGIQTEMSKLVEDTPATCAFQTNLLS